jgi:hypothetical protein
MVKKQSLTTILLWKLGKGESCYNCGNYEHTVPAEVQDQYSENSTQARQGAEHCGHIAKTENSLS